MPIYEYVCSNCATKTDILQGINDPAPTFCPTCGAEGTLRKQFAPPTIHFKGSGWAKKDRGSSSSGARASRSSSSDGAKDGATDGGSSSGAGSSSPSSGSSESGPSGASGAGGSSGSKGSDD
jgi:putative FmdB family regulatory protein